ncbi:hypothetical protein DA803_02230 [[Mycoplasma] phocae]|uniref:Polymerase/histidinol phosphatase N-terminal domain-containing protein n=1 Tax=[Mycoplasma] phocae TaxID=142651 RepID=A0A2Z5IQA3_9BACT|nr:hypothetical protein DA803_02230 [[Mycoplasma] phocae]
MNYILIDLHTHSSDSGKTGSNISGESDLEKLEILVKHNVKVACFSDHDKFYLKNYQKRLEIIKKYHLDLVLFPGIEIDLKRIDHRVGQAVFVFNPDDDLVAIQNLFSGPKTRYSYAEIIAKLADFDFMVFPHAGKGKDNMLVDDLGNFQVDALDITDENHANVKKILAKRAIPLVTFSDTHTWKKYPQFSKKQTYVQSEVNFSAIKRAIQENKIIIE